MNHAGGPYESELGVGGYGFSGQSLLSWSTSVSWVLFWHWWQLQEGGVRRIPGQRGIKQGGGRMLTCAKLLDEK